MLYDSTGDLEGMAQGDCAHGHSTTYSPDTAYLPNTTKFSEVDQHSFHTSREGESRALEFLSYEVDSGLGVRMWKAAIDHGGECQSRADKVDGK